MKRKDSKAKQDLSSVAKTRSAPEVVCTFELGVQLWDVLCLQCARLPMCTRCLYNSAYTVAIVIV